MDDRRILMACQAFGDIGACWGPEWRMFLALHVRLPLDKVPSMGGVQHVRDAKAGARG